MTIVLIHISGIFLASIFTLFNIEKDFIMSIIQAGMPIDLFKSRAIDTNKSPIMKIQEASELKYQNFIEGEEQLLKVKHIQASDTSRNPSYKEYASIQVNGNIVASIDNNGFVKSSNDFSSKLHSAMAGDNGLKGPALAQDRAAIIAELTGGKVVKSSTALSQNQFNSVDTTQFNINHQAMVSDPNYLQLQKTKEARTLFITQQISQLSEGDGETENTKSNNAVKEFLSYMDKTTEEKFFEAFLNKMGLTKEQFDALPADEKADIEKAIQEEIKEETKNKVSSDTNISII